MRAAVFGAGGMLGAALIQELERRGVEVSPWPHTAVDIADPVVVGGAFGAGHPFDVVFNAAGVLNTSHDGPAMVRANALGPHVLTAATRAFNIPLIHVSTDCVFSGHAHGRRGYTVQSQPDPRDLYGRSKLAGEVDAPGVTVVRTSFVGPEHGLWAWLGERAAAGDTIDGWTGARWSGSTVWAVAAGLVDLIDGEAGQPYRSHGFSDRAPPGGIIHLATEEPISKFEVLEFIDEAEDWGVGIAEFDGIRIDRELVPTHVLEPFGDAIRRRTS